MASANLVALETAINELKQSLALLEQSLLALSASITDLRSRVSLLETL